MGFKTDLSGQVFHKLTVLEYSHYKGERSYWRCLCVCGKEKVAARDALTSGRAGSCGCSRTETLRNVLGKHLRSTTKEYTAWQRMKARCYNPNFPNYCHYGGRGIRVCDEWFDNFNAFFECIGVAPSSKHSIDRIDVNGNYEPGNVRWATQKEQMNNTRRSKKKVL